MEWMLQVVDDLDDTVNAVLHSCVGLNADLGRITAVTLFVAVIAGGVAAGAATTVLCTAGGALGLTFVIRMLKGRGAPGRPQRV